MKNTPIIFNPDKPLAHYEQSGKRYKKVKARLAAGIAATVPAFLLGAACIIFDPRLMAIYTLFAVPFTLISIVGCATRREKMCLTAVPLGVILAIISVISESFFAPLGAAAYLIASLAEFMAVSASNEFYELKELPGFPLFDPSMDDITFAAKDHLGTDEFIDESALHEEKKVYRFSPEELEPSENMDEIVTGVSLLKENAEPTAEKPPAAEAETVPAAKELMPEKDAESAYDRMMKVQTENNNEFSDIDLFG
ncbi:MAG: hypothetical protein NC395_07550 [Prevotella sp.]|nr:hypothetical protein [Prevotella sp.]